MRAIDSLVAGLIDYAGLYPPASLDMRSAARNYVSYVHGKHAPVLGRFIVDVTRLAELREVAGGEMSDVRLNVIASPTATAFDSLRRSIDDGFPIDTIEIKAAHPEEIERIGKSIRSGLTTYFEVPVGAYTSEALAAIVAVGGRAKLRMGGVVADAFPSTHAVASILKTLADRRIPFKATAGLHHPIRSHHPFTYEPGSPAGTMHGFMNLCCAAALLHFDGEVGEAKMLLEEENSAGWQVTPDAVGWRSFRWTTQQLRSFRERFLISIGSCSFEEPIHDLEALGWL